MYLAIRSPRVDSALGGGKRGDRVAEATDAAVRCARVSIRERPHADARTRGADQRALGAAAQRAAALDVITLGAAALGTAALGAAALGAAAQGAAALGATAMGAALAAEGECMHGLLLGRRIPLGLLCEELEQ